MSKSIYVLLTVFLLMRAPVAANAQVTDIISIVSSAAKKVITALDLEVQKLQTQTIALQDAQRVVENAMSELQLGDISSWLSQEESLYKQYYNELWQIKNVISDYDRIQQIIVKQTALVSEYKAAYGLLKQDSHFSTSEVNHMYQVYSGIIQQSVDNLNAILMAITALVTQMSDAARFKIIDGAAGKIDKNYTDMQQFTQENELISLQRSKSQHEINEVKAIYNLP
jgi:hypothetical protein